VHRHRHGRRRGVRAPRAVKKRNQKLPFCRGQLFVGIISAKRGEKHQYSLSYRLCLSRGVDAPALNGN
jgi:hypothetical protein